MGLLDGLTSNSAETTNGRWFKSVANLFGHRYRRVRKANGRRLHIELRDVGPERFAHYASMLEDSFGKLEGVEWVRINGHLARAVVSYRSALVSVDEIEALVDGIEVHLGLDDEPFSGRRPEHPADIEPIARKLVDMSADALAVTLSTALMMTGYESSEMGTDLAALANVIDNTPRFREALAGTFGEEAVDVGFGTINSFVQGLGSGPIGPLIDLIYQGVKLRGEQARQEVWGRREPELCYKQWDRRRTPVDPGARPHEVPEGIIEAYANDAFFASVGGFVVGLADTHNLESSTPPLFGGLPKAARYGRDGFIAEVVRIMAEKDIIPLVPSTLPVMDRVDTVVIDGDLLFTGELLVGRVEVVDGVDAEEARRRAHELFEVDSPTQTHRDGRWGLGPVGAFEKSLSNKQRQRARKLASPKAPVLVLVHDEKLQALVQTRPATDPGAEQLLNSARRANLHIVIACDDRDAGESLGPDRVVPYNGGLTDIVRDQQRGGAAVALVASGPSTAMAAADLGIGIDRGADGPPWAADILCDDDLDSAGFVLEACAEAKAVAEQSVGLAGLGAAIATFLSLKGLSDTKPGNVMLGVNAVSVAALANGVRRAVLLERKPRPPRRDPTPWHSLELDEVFERVDSSTEGLTNDNARKRSHAPPSAPSKSELIASAVGKELANPFTPVLAAAAGISAVVGSLGDAAMVSAAMALNGVIGGYERYKAEKAVAALEEREAEDVRVLRDGREVILDVDDIVQGDIVVLHAGDVVPADCRLVTAEDLEVDESSLTGESLPVPKSVRPSYAAAVADRTSMLYEGTSIAVGRARAVVVAVGTETEARRGVLAGRGRTPETGVEQRLQALTDVTMPVAGLSGLFLIASGLARGQEVERLVDAGVGMSIAAVPEGLPLLSTVAQLAASRRLSEHGVLVRNPRAVEGLGRVDAVCADKTGTLTEGRIELDTVCDAERCLQVDGEPESWQTQVLAAALRASPAEPDEHELPHPTDRAVVNGAIESGVEPAAGYEQWQRMDEMPFEPGRGFHAVLGRTEDGLLISIKGAPEVVIPRCSKRATDNGHKRLNKQMRQKLIDRAEELAGRGLRVLAVAERAASEERDLDEDRIAKFVFRGFVGLSDPVRPTSKGAVRELRQAGVDVLMITGDHPRTAQRIAQELDLINGGRILTGPELEEMSDAELDEALLHCTVIARATPAHKVRIVEALQRDGKTVAMTGDGANDASAIRLADVGIALGEDATTAAREAADIIVVDERIETIVRAVAEGRAMWGSVRDAVSILTGGNFGEIGFTVLASLLAEPPLNARQLLLINLLTDIAPSLSIVMRRPTEHDLHAFLSSGPEQELGKALSTKIWNRAATTAGGASLAYFMTRMMLGGRRKASTVSLLSAVGTQLGQTLAVGKPTRQTTVASLGSAAVLLGIVETPGVSQLFGCCPVGPIGLATALGSSTLATGVSAAVPPVVRISKELGETLRKKLRELGNYPSHPLFERGVGTAEIEEDEKAMAAE
ncbi:HAD-IC family P-type ATPase [Persicimonas caeni]|uniref:HAD-IC family P-type ATPase n=1 Tax=Persicimonas caeni TaxID=2292766 RepID=A0A4Y6Q0T3_PERCE|nr:HAD-IC family P-type ATPase [Persicimonas caeni]QDG54133.1 HAD-IC family P-type ATPase [Persicimonas caeni]QED35354.1 HAD-IC family P-type ATPase [Persicimonas caeni]